MAHTLLPLALITLGLTLATWATLQGAAPTLAATTGVACILVGLLKDFDNG